MYRLKKLDDEIIKRLHNDVGPEVEHELELVPAGTFLDKAPSSLLAAQPRLFTHLVASAAVFHTHDEVPRLLVIQRSENESYPGHWELPGGMAEPKDETIEKAIARELVEETGLVAQAVRAQVLPAETFDTGWAKRTKHWLKITFLVDVKEPSQLEAEDMVTLQDALEAKAKDPDSLAPHNIAGPADADTAAINAHQISGIKSQDDNLANAKAQDKHATSTDPSTKEMSTEVGDHEGAISKEEQPAPSANEDHKIRGSYGVHGIGAPMVRIDPSEHQHFLWVTEEEVHKRAVGDRELQFVAEAAVATMLKAFAMHKAMA